MYLDHSGPIYVLFKFSQTSFGLSFPWVVNYNLILGRWEKVVNHVLRPSRPSREKFYRSSQFVISSRFLRMITRSREVEHVVKQKRVIYY